MSSSYPDREAKLIEILQNAQEGEKIRNLARLYGILESTIRGRIRGAQTARKAQEKAQLLSPLQEKHLVKFLLHEEACGRALSKCELRDVAAMIAHPDEEAAPESKR